MGLKIEQVVDQPDAVRFTIAETKIGQGSHIDVLQLPIDDTQSATRFELEISANALAALIRHARDIDVVQQEIERQEREGF